MKTGYKNNLNVYYLDEQENLVEYENINEITGDINTVLPGITNMRGDINEITGEITPEEREKGININELLN